MANPELAEKIIAEGKADMVAIGTGLLADPYWVKKVEEGNQERIRPCIGCYDGCMGRITKGKPLSCAVNPATGRERVFRLERAERPRKVMVVGGGPAGLEAARVASMRGHQVVLYEKDNSLGGHLLEASVPDFKKDLAKLLDWYKKELANLNLDIKMGQEVSAEMMRKENPPSSQSSPRVRYRSSPISPGWKKIRFLRPSISSSGRRRLRKKYWCWEGG